MKRAHLLLASAASVGTVLHAGHYRNGWVDDAYISFRYAQNLADGLGMVFNEGEHLEGLTNLGWALLLTPFSDGDMMGAAKLLGLLAAALTPFALAAWASRAKVGVYALAVALSAYTLAPWAPSWSMQGLETSAVMLLMTAAWGGYDAERDNTRWPIGAVALALAPWMRPDAALLTGLVGAWHLWTGGKWGKGARRAVLFSVLSALSLVVLKQLWFGELLPNPFHVKVNTWPPERGVLYLRRFFLFPHPVLPMTMGVATVGGLIAAARQHRAGLPALVAAAWMALAVLVNGDFMLNFRFLTPAWPALCAALGLAAAWLVARIPAGRGRIAGQTALGLALILSLAPHARLHSADELNSDQPTRPPHQKATHVFAPWQSNGFTAGRTSHTPFPAAWALVNLTDDQAIGYTDIGLIGYVFPGPVVDLLALTDRVMAGRGGQKWPEQWRYLQRRVSVFILDTQGGQWTRFREPLAEAGWRVVDGCGPNWVFAHPSFEATPLPSPELQARLTRTLRREPTSWGLHAAITDELIAADTTPELRTWWLAALRAAAPPDRALDMQRLACALGEDPDGTCVTAPPSCEASRSRGQPERVTSDQWPSPRFVVADAPDPSQSRVKAPTPEPLPLEAHQPTPAAPPPCTQDQAPARVAWAAAADAWAAADHPQRGAAKRAARRAIARMDAGPADAIAAAKSAMDVANQAPEAEAALLATQHAFQVSMRIWEGCQATDRPLGPATPASRPPN